MKIETEPREDHQVRVIAQLEPSVLEKYKHQAARKISQETKIPGFRPGKAPYSVIRRMFSEEAIQEQAVELMVDDIYPEVLKEASIKPTYPGVLDEIVSLDPPKLAFVIPLNPEVKLNDYREVRKDFEAGTVTDEDVDAFVKRMQTSYATAEPVERPIEEGDLVAVKVTGTLTHPDEDQEAELIKETPFQVVVGDTSEEQDTWPYPGFSKTLVGLSAGDEKDQTYVYPEDSDLEKLRGKEIVFHATVQSVKSMHKPELNDEFAQSLGDYENMDAVRTAVRKQLEANKQQEYERGYFNDLVDEIVAQATIAYPPQMLQEEEQQVLRSLEQDLAQQRMDMDAYLKMIESDKEAFIAKEVSPAAKRRLERSLVLDQIARDENIRLAEEELQSAFAEAYQELQSTTDMQKMQRKISSERLSELLSYEAASRALNRRVLQRLKEIATGQEPAAAEEEAEAATAEMAAPEGEAETTAEETSAPIAEAAETPEKTEDTPANDEENPAETPEA